MKNKSKFRNIFLKLKQLLGRIHQHYSVKELPYESLMVFLSGIFKASESLTILEWLNNIILRVVTSCQQTPKSHFL
jgi:hypothetical protein